MHSKWESLRVLKPRLDSLAGPAPSTVAKQGGKTAHHVEGEVTQF